MGEEQQRYEDGHDEIAGAQLTRLEPNLIAPVESEEGVSRAPDMEDSILSSRLLAERPAQRLISLDHVNYCL